MYKFKEHTWKDLENGILQKIYINNKGQPTFTYHTGKSGKPITVFEVRTKVAHMLSGYALIDKDLRDIQVLLEYMIKFKDNLDIFTPGSTPKEATIFSFLFKSLVITYGKCFCEAYGRKVKLEKKIISKHFHELHDELMDLRHQYVAHSGISGYRNDIYEEHSYIYLLLQKKKSSETKFYAQAEVKNILTRNNIENDCMPLINDLMKDVEKKKNRLLERLNYTMKNNIELLLTTANKSKKKRIILDDAYFENLSKTK